MLALQITVDEEINKTNLLGKRQYSLGEMLTSQ